MGLEKPRQPSESRGAKKLRLFVAAAGLAFAGPHTAEAAPGYEHVKAPGLERVLDTRNNEWKNFNKNPTVHSLDIVLRTLATSDTKWVTEIQKNPERFHAGSRALFSKEGSFRGNGTVLRIRDQEQSAGGSPRYNYVLVTAAHVVEAGAIPPNGARWVADPEGRDVAISVLSAEQAVSPATHAIDALHLSTTAEGRERDVSGMKGLVLGHDTIPSFSDLHRKIYPTTITPLLSEKIANVLGLRVTSEQHWDSTRMVIIPPGETLPAGGSDVEASGVSGSPYLFVPPGGQGVEFGGIIVSVMPVSVQYPDGTVVTYEIGFVVDHRVVRNLINKVLGGDSRALR